MLITKNPLLNRALKKSAAPFIQSYVFFIKNEKAVQPL